MTSIASWNAETIFAPAGDSFFERAGPRAFRRLLSPLSVYFLPINDLTHQFPHASEVGLCSAPG